MAANCKKCGAPFHPAMHRIEHCAPCFKKMRKQFASASTEEVMQAAMKSLTQQKENQQ